MSTQEKVQKEFKSEEETIKFARDLGKQLIGGECIELVGDVGSGKTTFVKGLASGAGNSSHVTSPSFAIKQVYEGRVSICHYDFYRLEEPGIMKHELEESLGSDAVTIIEWARTVEGFLPKDRIKIQIKPTGDQSREISLQAPESSKVRA